MTYLRVPSAPWTRPRWLSVLRRLALLALAVVLGSITLIAVLLGGAARASVHASPPPAEGPIPVGRASSDGPIVVAVVLGHSGSDDADALAPYEVFARSTKFSVYSVAATIGPSELARPTGIGPSAVGGLAWTLARAAPPSRTAIRVTLPSATASAR